MNLDRGHSECERRGSPTCKLDWLFLRALSLKKGFCVVDAASTPTRSPPRDSIRARAEKRLLMRVSGNEITTGTCVPTAGILEL